MESDSSYFDFFWAERCTYTYEIVAEDIYKEVEQNPEFFGVYAFCAEFPNKNGV